MKVRYFEKRGQIWLDFKTSNGDRKRVPSGATTEAEAEKLAPAIIARMERESSEPVAAPKVPAKATAPATGWTIQRAYREGLRTREQWMQARDPGDLETRYKGLTAYWGEDCDLGRCTRDAVLTWREAMMKAPGKRKDTTLSPSTINHRLSMLSTLLEVANLPPHTVKHLSTKGSGRTRRAREDELQAVHAWLLANHHRPGALDVADLLLMGTQTAARPSEMLRLAWADVYFDRRVALLRETKTSTPREVPLTDAVTRLLERRKGLGLPTPFAGLTQDRYVALWAAARKAIGLADDHEFVFYVATRHEGLSRLADEGANEFQVRALAGHANIATSNRYVKPNMASIRALVERASVPQPSQMGDG